MKRELQEQEQLYNPEIDPASLNDGPQTRDTLQLYYDQGKMDLRGKFGIEGWTQTDGTWGAALGKDSDSEFAGYTADDEDSSALRKVFQNRAKRTPVQWNPENFEP
jgi:hypothetical protein